MLHFLDNLLLIQKGGPLGSNGPLWSLSYEWWYYVLFAGALLCVDRTRSRPIRITAVVAIVLMAVLLPFHLLYMGTIWLLGLLAAIFVARIDWRPPLWVGATAFLLTFALPVLGSSAKSSAIFFATDLLCGLGFTTLLLSACRERGPFEGLPKISHVLAEFSYSLYLMHFPLLVLISATIGMAWGIPPLHKPDFFGICLFMGTFCVLICGFRDHPGHHSDLIPAGFPI